MALKCGIVGLPNVGKSTLFNCLSNAKAQSANFPFCTIEPNIGVITVPDVRLNKLADIIDPENVQPTTIDIVDIAGLVKGASKGEGLGNQFLANIRETDAILHVLRCFDNDNIVHVDGNVNPIRDKETIDMELQLKDLETVDKKLEKVKRAAKTGNKEAQKEEAVLLKIKENLEAGISDFKGRYLSHDKMRGLLHGAILGAGGLALIGAGPIGAVIGAGIGFGRGMWTQRKSGTKLSAGDSLKELAFLSGQILLNPFKLYGFYELIKKMEELEKYKKVNEASSLKELADIIRSFAVKGFIHGKTRIFEAEKMAMICEKYSLSYHNGLTREFGIRQQAMMLLYYNKINNSLLNIEICGWDKLGSN